MGWQGQGQHVSELVLHAKQVYFMPQRLTPSSSTSFMCLHWFQNIELEWQQFLRKAIAIAIYKVYYILLHWLGTTKIIHVACIFILYMYIYACLEHQKFTYTQRV